MYITYLLRGSSSVHKMRLHACSMISTWTQKQTKGLCACRILITDCVIYLPILYLDKD